MALGQLRASLVVETVKNPPAMQDTWVRSLGQENPLEEGMAPIPVFLPGKSHGQRRLLGYNLWGSKTAGHDLVTKQQKPKYWLTD